jgi:Ni/Co efflux regulator RcnB
MKKIILLAILTVAGMTTTMAQTKKATTKTTTKTTAAKPATTKVEAAKQTPTKAEPVSGEGAGMVFENETIDFGTIQQNADGKREFVLTNNGTQPLVIESTQGSCGCTVPTKPEKPVQPGEKAVIGVKYDTNRVGSFTKTVTVKSNAVGQETKVLTIKGNVLAAPASETPAPTKS